MVAGCWCCRCLEVHMATLRVFYDKWVVAIAAAEDDNGDGDANLTDEEKMYVLSPSLSLWWCWWCWWR